MYPLDHFSTTHQVVLLSVVAIHVFFRLAYFIYIGSTLERMSKRRLQGPRIHEWYEFKRRACFILMGDFLTFVASAALSYKTFDSEYFSEGFETAAIAIGAVFLVVGTFVKLDAYRVIGDEGWYWYNSFIPPGDVKYEKKGVYKYLDNPMYGVGYLSLVGVALLLRSFPGLVLALFDWFVVFVFLLIFELE